MRRTTDKLSRKIRKRKTLFISKSTNFADIHYINETDYGISAPPSELKQLELLFEKLKIQFYFCFVGILLTILVYLAIWSNSRCCELPFKENSCVGRGVFPLPWTNHSTLAKEVDEFLSDSRAKISNLHSSAELSLITDRQIMLEVTKNKLWQLIERHSGNLAAFGVIKREDERMEELEVAITDGYINCILLPMLGLLYIGVFGMCIGVFDDARRKSNSPFLYRTKEVSAEESDNSKNARIKKLKRRIPIFYLATWFCIIVELGLIAVYLSGQYHARSCPIFSFIEDRRKLASRSGEEYLPKSFTNYHTFADELQSTLDIHLEELNKIMQSPNLETRQLGWKYEHNAIEAAFRRHNELKQYHVDRNMMPREIKSKFQTKGPQ
ncbi:hypothetical protein Ddc_10212 [Ditylenchus destructor]|nr:hypothetical protein Ddc_10212 [Ditylenchus destructor]